MAEQSKVAQPYWTEAQLSILNKHLPAWLEDTVNRKQELNEAWEEIKATLTKNVVEGMLPDGAEKMHTVSTCPRALLKKLIVSSAHAYMVQQPSSATPAQCPAKENSVNWIVNFSK